MPAEVVKGSALYFATLSSPVARSGATASHTFFFAIWLGAKGSPGQPSNMTRSPMAAPSGGMRSSTVFCDSFSIDAQRTIACDSMPRIFAGLRLQSSTARRLVSSSFGM